MHEFVFGADVCVCGAKGMTGGSSNAMSGGFLEADTSYNFHHGSDKFIEAGIAGIGKRD